MTKPNMEHWPKKYQNDHWCELGIDAFCEVHGRDVNFLTFPVNSLCTAGKSCSARDLNQLSVCLLVVCLMTTTVGEAYLVRTIG
jgi:hypothetical protein